MPIQDYTYVTTQLYQSVSTPNPIIAELPFTRVNFTSQLSSIGAFTGELLLSGVNAANLNVDAGTTPGKVILWVLHGGTPVWSGVIWNREYDSDTQIMKINAQEMLSYYQHRRIYKFTGSSYYQANAGGTGSGGLVYGNLSTGVGIDPLIMLSDLLTGANASSHGNIGVTYVGPSSSSGTAIRTFYDFELKSVYQAWKDLSTSSTFFDFLIKPYLDSSNRLVNYLVAGTPTFGATYNSIYNGSLNFEFPGNIVSYTYKEDSAKVGNNVFGLGYGANNNRLISKYYDRSKIYGSNTWPLLEENVNMIDIVSTDLLKQTTIGKLLAIGYPPTTLQIVIPSYVDPYLGTYGVGDQVKVLINDDRFPKGLSNTPTNTATVYSDGGVLPDTGTSSIYRIIAINVEPGENGPDRVTLTLNLPLATTLTAG